MYISDSNFRGIILRLRIQYQLLFAFIRLKVTASLSMTYLSEGENMNSCYNLSKQISL